MEKARDFLAAVLLSATPWIGYYRGLGDADGPGPWPFIITVAACMLLLWPEDPAP